MRRQPTLTPLIVAVLVAAPGVRPLEAQEPPHDRHADHVSPYAGQESSEIPSLTGAELEELRTGAGMGLARAAELNHFPGPKHVLEMAGALGLSEEQRTDIERVRAAMESAVIDLGESIIETERTLNMRFRHGHIDEDTLEEMVAGLAELRGRLRFVHLRAHLETTAVLTDEQIASYDRLRGYGSSP